MDGCVTILLWAAEVTEPFKAEDYDTPKNLYNIIDLVATATLRKQKRE